MRDVLPRSFQRRERKRAMRTRTLWLRDAQKAVGITEGSRGEAHRSTALPVFPTRQSEYGTYHT